jgi:His-Xaa-Ser system protein HxsD
MAESSDNDSARIDFDSRIYSLDVIQRAALKFSDVCSLSFTVISDHGIGVDIQPLAGRKASVSQVAGLLKNEVLDQALRERIAKETETERNLILAYAFSNTKLVQS